MSLCHIFLEKIILSLKDSEILRLIANFARILET